MHKNYNNKIKNKKKQLMILFLKLYYFKNIMISWNPK